MGLNHESLFRREKAIVCGSTDGIGKASAIHDSMKWADGIIINPGAYSHYSYAIRDAISAVNLPTIEVHLSDIRTREDFRKISVIKSVCVAQIIGQGKFGYLEGLHQLIHIIKSA
ncbi:MAG: type II 3-dehydroquinate dehydratase [Candidatus Marinimicrobia bacterium]|jgi:3-dehydroquinate dehydratase-2|nr:type II 3-dehydroquinate dehydratase [Candidatus Neomarinimicrobiota bacterium]